MFIDSENFDLSSDLEIDTLLADLPFDLIKENIKDQINNPLSTKINYVNTIVEKCDVIKKEFDDDPDVISTVNTSLREFFEFIIQEIDNKFDLSIDTTIEDNETVITIGDALYNVLILRFKKNISKFIYKFIVKNKKSLVEQFDKKAKKKDVTSISLKKQIKNKDDILLLSNLPDVIKFIMNLYIEPLDFLKYACDDKHYEGTILWQMISNGKIIGNFVTEYFKIITDEYDYVLDEVQTDVKMRLIKKIM